MTLQCYLQIGNALLDDETDQNGIIDYAWDHGVISDRVFNDVKRDCNFTDPNVTLACHLSVDNFYKAYEPIDIYSLYTPTCENSEEVTQKFPVIRGAAPHLFSQHVSRNFFSIRTFKK